MTELMIDCILKVMKYVDQNVNAKSMKVKF